MAVPPESVPPPTVDPSTLPHTHTHTHTVVKTSPPGSATTAPAWAKGDPVITQDQSSRLRRLVRRRPHRPCAPGSAEDTPAAVPRSPPNRPAPDTLRHRPHPSGRCFRSRNETRSPDPPGTSGRTPPAPFDDPRLSRPPRGQRPRGCRRRPGVRTRRATPTPPPTAPGHNPPAPPPPDALPPGVRRAAEHRRPLRAPPR